MITPRRLFLLDGLGALLSAFLLGVVLVHFESTFGMPSQTLHGLAAIAGVFCLYSLTCSLLNIEQWRGGLRLIASANLLYCCLTLGAMLYLHQDLSLLGFAYFAGEIAVVVALATLELRTASRPSEPGSS
ncbi:MAG: hypothetical protein GY811_14320 [Myxococcales bacterium]|nr:hypothetical protein [Myxococcales bacterium]